MSKYSIKNFVGMDIGDHSNQICVLDRDGAVAESTGIENSIDGMNSYFDHFEVPKEVLVAIETGTHSPWISHLLEARGFKVLVGNARKLRMIWNSTRKDDERDAEMLARIARFDPQLLSPIRHRSRSAHMDLTVIKARDALVRCRTDLINFVRGTCKSAGTRLPSCSAEAFSKRVIDFVPEELLAAVVPCISTIMALTDQIRGYDRKIEELCQQCYPETNLLREITGVGPVTALSYVLTLEDPKRFKKSRDVGPYLGLTPKRDQSGNTDKALPISKAGNGYLRRLLVGSANYILGPFGPDCLLRRFGDRIASGGGKAAKRRAVVAVARKLAVLMHSLWKNNGLYDPWFSLKSKAV